MPPPLPLDVLYTAEGAGKYNSDYFLTETFKDTGYARTSAGAFNAAKSGKRKHNPVIRNIRNHSPSIVHTRISDPCWKPGNWQSKISFRYHFL